MSFDPPLNNRANDKLVTCKLSEVCILIITTQLNSLQDMSLSKNTKDPLVTNRRRQSTARTTVLLRKKE